MLWIKALHIITVITWFAAMFYLPRLFVYHAMAEDSISLNRFIIMERKLYRGIMTPSMVLVILSGGILLHHFWPVFKSSGWLHVKLLLVATLVAYHFYCGKLRNDFAEGRNAHGHVFYRWLNEAPVIALIIIVIMVVVKPF
ncbi:MAG: protoporphyrinogen oxidase HemJ [Gammaproteobacteria bacterium]|nr:MAG: protoporphyrinogen oxidase HemJ [Gammaproteobacteria bacterium]